MSADATHTRGAPDSAPAGLPRDGLVVVAKRDCPTCTLIEPVYRELRARAAALTVLSQDDPDFPPLPGVIDDRALAHSWRLEIETVPTLIRFDGGKAVARTEGWDRAEWERVSGLDALGQGLPAFRPGCGSLSVMPGMAESLRARHGETGLRSRRVALDAYQDEVEACYERGWSDGLPVVPPTEARVLRMLAGAPRDPGQVLGEVPPALAPCTVEKAAVNAVLAGCRPEYFPVVLAALEAALEPDFCLHGLLCTTYFSGPIVIVNGPVTRRIGMNCGINVLGQGNRANSTIGRALQLVVRNVGGGLPGGIDRATFGTPAKVGLAIAEDESDDSWQPLAAARGIERGRSAVTLFGGDGVLANFDQLSRTPESLTRSLAASLMAIGHPKKAQGHDALLLLSPEHYRVYRDAGWDRARIEAALRDATTVPSETLVRGAGGVAEGMPEGVAGTPVAKFRPGGLLLMRAGGAAGLMSAIIGGWAATGERGSAPVSRVID